MPLAKLVNRTPEEVEKLRRIVSNVLGADTVRGDQITVEEMPFNDQLATEVTHTLETQERRDFWWKLARNLAYPALAIGVLLVFLAPFKRTAKDEIPIGIPVGRLTLNGGNGNGNGQRQRRRPVSPSAVENPLRKWSPSKCSTNSSKKTRQHDPGHPRLADPRFDLLEVVTYAIPANQSQSGTPAA